MARATSRDNSLILHIYIILRAPTADMGYVHLAHIPHQTKFDPIYQML